MDSMKPEPCECCGKPRDLLARLRELAAVYRKPGNHDYADLLEEAAKEIESLRKQAAQ